jgi:hypothetical protein
MKSSKTFVQLIINFLENVNNKSFKIPTSFDFEKYIIEDLSEKGFKIGNGKNISSEEKKYFLDLILKGETVWGDDFSNKFPQTKIAIGDIIKTPFGKQSFPDFLIRVEDKILFIEAKSSESGDVPMWNSGIPTTIGIYVFAKVDLKKGTDSYVSCCMGSNLLSKEDYTTLKDFEENLRNIASSFSKVLKQAKFNFDAYPRVNFNQKNITFKDLQVIGLKTVIDHISLKKADIKIFKE